MPNLPPRPTLAHVAKLAGVSVSAVSLILNDVPNSGLSDGARRRVEEAANELDYRPNRIAKALKRNSTGTVGFVSDSVITTRYASGLVNGALKKTSQSGEVLLFLETLGSEVGLKQAIETALDHQVDAIIVAAMQAKKIILPKVPATTKIILLNAISDNHKISILPDEENGGRAAVRVLINAGISSNIALIGRNSLVENDVYHSATIRRRLGGIRSEMKKFKVQFTSEVFCDNWEPEDGYKSTLKLLRNEQHIKALICMNDRLAVGAYRAVSELGLNIPDNISIISFDRDSIGDLLSPTLTSIALPYEKMGEIAIDLLSQENIIGEHLIDMPLFIGGSTP